MGNLNREWCYLNLADGIKDIPEYEWYGITYQNATRKSTEATCKIIKSLYPESKIVVGGAGANHHTIKHADYIVKGESELDLSEWFNNPTSCDFGYIGNLDLVKEPYRDESCINRTGIHGSNELSTTIMATRGCPYNCSFCDKAHGMSSVYRMRSPEMVIQEIISLNSTYDIKHVRFVDDCLTCNEAYTIELCGKLKSVPVSFICITRADRVNERIMKALASAGCTQIDFGIESGSQRILDLMNKRTTVEQNGKAIQLAKENGIKVKAFLMMDYPSEFDSDKRKTLEFVDKYKPDMFSLSKYSSDEYFYPDNNKEWISFKEEIEKLLQVA